LAGTAISEKDEVNNSKKPPQGGFLLSTETNFNFSVKISKLKFF